MCICVHVIHMTSNTLNNSIYVYVCSNWNSVYDSYVDLRHGHCLHFQLKFLCMTSWVPNKASARTKMCVWGTHLFSFLLTCDKIPSYLTSIYSSSVRRFQIGWNFECYYRFGFKYTFEVSLDANICTPFVPKWLSMFLTLVRLRSAEHWPSSCKYNSWENINYSKMP